MSPSSTPTAARPSTQGSARSSTLAADLRVSVLRTARRLRAEKADADITDTQYSALTRLDRSGPLTASDLAEVERVQPPSMTRTVAALEQKGLVTRTTHPADRRQVLVALTPDGRDTVARTRRRRDAWLARRIAELDPADRDVLAAATTILRRIADS